MVREIKDADFEIDILKSELPVLVDFWAPWCSPCHMITPVLQEVAEETREKLKVFKCNVDEAPLTAINYGIRGIPTLMLFKDGKTVEQLTGIVSKEHLISKLVTHIGSNGDV